MLDCLIVGGGPAGLSAALVLGRCRRDVLLCDDGTPRNAVSRGVRGFLSRNGILPAELRQISREQLQPYENVEIRDLPVSDVDFCEGGFSAKLADGREVRARKLILATGIEDVLPDIPGFRELYGNGVFNCPYCDGWEERDRPLAVYGKGEKRVGFAVEMTLWSRDLVLCTDGDPLSAEERNRLSRNGIGMREEKIARLEGGEGGLDAVLFESGEPLARDGLFFITGERRHCTFATKLGCELTDKGAVKTYTYEKTKIPGLYVAGDASRGVQFAIVAAAEGAMAAFAVNNELIAEDVR